MELKKHIAVLCDYHLLPDRIGGMDHFFWAFQEKCNDNNVSVDWFFPNRTDIIEYSEFKINVSEDESVEDYFLNFLQNEKIKYSHIFTHFLELCTPFYKKVKNISGAKIIAIDHNPRPLGGFPLKKRLKKRIKGILYGKYIDLFVGVSDYTSREIVKDFGKHLSERTITVYNGITTENIKKRKLRDYKNPTFLVASHLRESKGIQDLISAVSLLSSKDIAKLKIDIYGDGPFRNDLVKQIDANNLQKVFTFMGSVDNLNQIYCQYDYMLQPTHMECFSLSVLESLAANVPVITTAVGGNKEVVLNGYNGFIFPAKGIKSCASIISRILNESLIISENTYPKVEEEFSIKTMVKNHFKLSQ